MTLDACCWGAQALAGPGLDVMACSKMRSKVCSNLRALLPGEQAIALAGLGLQVTACDPSGGLVQRCEENAAKFGFSKNVRARQSDFLNLTKVCVCVCVLCVYVYM